MIICQQCGRATDAYDDGVVFTEDADFCSEACRSEYRRIELLAQMGTDDA